MLLMFHEPLDMIIRISGLCQDNILRTDDEKLALFSQTFYNLSVSNYEIQSKGEFKSLFPIPR